jgi:hypothetical protein
MATVALVHLETPRSYASPSFIRTLLNSFPVSCFLFLARHPDISAPFCAMTPERMVRKEEYHAFIARSQQALRSEKRRGKRG